MFRFRLSRSAVLSSSIFTVNCSSDDCRCFRGAGVLKRPVRTTWDWRVKCKIIVGHCEVQPAQGNTGIDLWEVIRQQQCARFKKILKEKLFSLVQINGQMWLVWCVLTKCSKDTVLKRLKSHCSSNFHLLRAMLPDFSQLSPGEGKEFMKVQGTWTRPEPWVK